MSDIEQGRYATRSTGGKLSDGSKLAVAAWCMSIAEGRPDLSIRDIALDRAATDKAVATTGTPGERRDFEK